MQGLLSISPDKNPREYFYKREVPSGYELCVPDRNTITETLHVTEKAREAGQPSIGRRFPLFMKEVNLKNAFIEYDVEEANAIAG